MEVAVILRVLHRHRRLVALAALASIAVGLLVAFHVSLNPPVLTSRQSSVGAATSRVVVQSSSASTLSLPQREVADNLGMRAALLADLMASAPYRTRVAKAAGLPEDQLTVLGPASAAPPIAYPLAQEATTAAALIVYPFVLRAQANGRTPIITFSTNAPDRATAARLARGAAAGLASAIRAETGPEGGVVIEQLGLVQARERTTGSKLALGIAATVLLFAVLCSVLVISSGVLRALRTTTVEPLMPEPRTRSTQPS